MQYTRNMAGEAINQTKATSSPLLSLVIPAYNESANIRRGVLEEVAVFLAAKPYSSQVMVIDDGSIDETASLVAAAVARHPHLFSARTIGHQGKAYAVRAGVEAATGQYVIFTDMDLSTPLSYVDDALTWLQAGYDVVIGSRFLPGGARLEESPLRRLMGVLFSYLVRTLVLPGIHDSQCGFKGFRREVARDLFGRLRVFRPSGGLTNAPRLGAFDVELLLLARRRRCLIKEMPVVWSHVPSRRVRPLQESLLMFREVMAIKGNDLRGRYCQNGHRSTPPS